MSTICMCLKVHQFSRFVVSVTLQYNLCFPVLSIVCYQKFRLVTIWYTSILPHMFLLKHRTMVAILWSFPEKACIMLQNLCIILSWNRYVKLTDYLFKFVLKLCSTQKNLQISGDLIPVVQANNAILHPKFYLQC